MQLLLQGNVNINHSDTRGYYLLSHDNVNGFPYWNQQNGNNAIWFQKSIYSGWTLGLKDFLGQKYSGVIGPDGITAWPRLISNGYSYWDGLAWQSNFSNDVTFEECKYAITKESL